jgi:hypothetical protein
MTTQGRGLTMKECNTTHPQPHEKLLVGWLVGGTRMGNRECHCCKHLLPGGWVGEKTKGEGDEEDHNDVPPILSLTSL